MGRMSDLAIEMDSTLGIEIERVEHLIDGAHELGRRGGILIRILSLVKVEWRGHKTPCWIYQGSDSGPADRRGGGYPRFSIDDCTVAVHRVLWMHFHGFLPSNRQLDHECKVRMCICPDHFEKMTQKGHAKKDGRVKNFNPDAPGAFNQVQFEGDDGA